MDGHVGDLAYRLRLMAPTSNADCVMFMSEPGTKWCSWDPR
jgi:hypothetical protein